MDTITVIKWEQAVRELHRAEHDDYYVHKRTNRVKPHIDLELRSQPPVDLESLCGRSWSDLTGLLMLAGALMALIYVYGDGQVIGWLLGQVPNVLDHSQATFLEEAHWITHQLSSFAGFFSFMR